MRTKLILQNYVNLTPRNGRYTQETHAARDRFLTAVLGIKAQGPTDPSTIAQPVPTTPEAQFPAVLHGARAAPESP
jgi:hypothetical protein